MIPRQLNLFKLLGNSRSAFLFGPRGAGKSVLAKKLAEQCDNALIIDLLKLENYRRYVTQPELFRREVEKQLSQTSHLLVVVDEVQKLPSLLDEVHYMLEAHKGRIQFLLTGSSARKLKHGNANLLAGRAWTLNLHPLSSVETDLELERALHIGTLPSVYLEDDNPERTLRAYVDTYLREEIFQEALVRNVEGFTHFIDIAAQNNAEPTNYSKIARQADLSPKTVKDYFSILVDTLVAFRVDGWSSSLRKQLTKQPKYYFFDCGVLNALCRGLGAVPSPGSYRYGKLFETFIVNEFFRINDYFELDYRFNHWRTNLGMEVDLVLSRARGEPLMAIEIKSGSSPREGDVKGLKAFASENKQARLICLSTTPRPYQLGSVEVMSWQDFFKELMRNGD